MKTFSTLLVHLVLLTGPAMAQSDLERFWKADFEVGHEGTLPVANEAYASQFGRSPASFYLIVKIKGDNEAIVRFNLLNKKDGHYYYFVGWPMEGKVDDKYYKLEGKFKIAGTQDLKLVGGGSERVFRVERDRAGEKAAEEEAKRQDEAAREEAKRRAESLARLKAEYEAATVAAEKAMDALGLDETDKAYLKTYVRDGAEAAQASLRKNIPNHIKAVQEFAKTETFKTWMEAERDYRTSPNR